MNTANQLRRKDHTPCSVPGRKIYHECGVIRLLPLAHSLTLAATALQLVPEALWFPPLVELLIWLLKGPFERWSSG